MWSMPRNSSTIYDKQGEAGQFVQGSQPMILKILDQQAGVHTVHRKKRFMSFPSPAGMSLTKHPLGRNNSLMTSLFPPRESLVVTSRLGTGNSRSIFLRCTMFIRFSPVCRGKDWNEKKGDKPWFFINLDWNLNSDPCWNCRTIYFGL